MASSEAPTVALLRLWNSGEAGALDGLLDRNLDWVRNFVHRRLGQDLRRRAETLDLVQDAMVRLLRYGPKFDIADELQFRALVARIVENTIRDEVRRVRRAGRSPDREQNDSVLLLGGPTDDRTRPAEAAGREEHRAWVQLAIEFLEPADREILALREWEQLEFPAIASRLGITEESAKKRFQRAVPRLHRRLVELRGDGLQRLLAEAGAGAGADGDERVGFDDG